MNSQVTFRASDVFDHVNVNDLYRSDQWTCNAVVEHLVDHYASTEWSSIRDLVHALEMDHWAAGSFGVIYNHEVAAFIGRNMLDIEEIVAEYIDATGETPKFRTFSDMLALAFDMAAHSIAMAIEHADLSLVINAVDYLDPSPEVIITDDPEDMVAEIIQTRLDMEVQHSPTTVPESDLAAMEETLAELVRVEL